MLLLYKITRQCALEKHIKKIIFCPEMPRIQPFTFGRDVINEGQVGQLLCTVVDGDEPLTITWSLQGEDLGSGPEIITSQIGTRSSLLMISSISHRHTGRYTCIASNAAGSSSHSAELKVNGKCYTVTGRHIK
jgi:hypothetical protein